MILLVRVAAIVEGRTCLVVVLYDAGTLGEALDTIFPTLVETPALEIAAGVMAALLASILMGDEDTGVALPM